MTISPLTMTANNKVQTVRALDLRRPKALKSSSVLRLRITGHIETQVALFINEFQLEQIEHGISDHKPRKRTR